MVLAEVNLVLEQRVQIRVHKLNDKANVHQIIMLRLPALALLRAALPLLRAYDLNQLWHERALILLIPLQLVRDLIEASKYLYLSQQLYYLVLCLRLLLHHFQCHFAASPLAFGFRHAAVAALADDRLQLILLYYAVPHHFIHAVLIPIVSFTRLAGATRSTILTGARPARCQLVERLFLHGHFVVFLPTIWLTRIPPTLSVIYILIRSLIVPLYGLMLVKRIVIIIHLRAGLSVLLQ